MKNKATISQYMTEFPHSIGDDMPLKTAQLMMQKHQFRHLPVQHAGKLVGVISDRDLKLALSFGSLEDLKVNELMVEEPYAVHSNTPFAEVLSQMVALKIGCTLITDTNGKLVGIFTATDGLKYLQKTIESASGNTA